MTAAERNIIDQAVRYPNDYRNIEDLVQLATQAITQRDQLSDHVRTLSNHIKNRLAEKVQA